jgi:energy-coupling factor transporter transmembrane protein EcfT
VCLLLYNNVAIYFFLNNANLRLRFELHFFQNELLVSLVPLQTRFSPLLLLSSAATATTPESSLVDQLYYQISRGYFGEGIRV